MLELLERERDRLRNLPRVEARDVVLNTVFPLFEALVSYVDENSIGTVADADFVDVSEKLVHCQSSLLIKALHAAGYLEETGDIEMPYRPTPAMPPFVARDFEEISQITAEWLAALAEVRFEEESDDDDNDDNDATGDGGDSAPDVGDGDGDGGS